MPPHAHAPEKKCPRGFLDELKALPLELEIAIVDQVTWPSDCAAAVPRRVEAHVDGKLAGVVELACSNELRAPPRRKAIPPIAIRAGEHEILVRELESGRAASERYVLPALELSSDARGIFAGAHVLVRVENDAISILPPTVISPKGL